MFKFILHVFKLDIVSNLHPEMALLLCYYFVIINQCDEIQKHFKFGSMNHNIGVSTALIILFKRLNIVNMSVISLFI